MNDRDHSSLARPKLLLDIREACDVTGLSRSKIYDEMANKRLKWVKVGTRRLIKPADLQAFVDSLSAVA